MVGQKRDKHPGMKGRPEVQVGNRKITSSRIVAIDRHVMASVLVLHREILLTVYGVLGQTLAQQRC